MKVAKRRGRPPKNPALRKDNQAEAQKPGVPKDNGNGSSSAAINGNGQPRNHIAELEERVRDRVDSWETESLYEDTIEGLAEETNFPDDVDACTPAEAAMYRRQLRALGPVEFCKQNIDAKLITAQKLLTAFGIRPPAFLEGAEDEAYFGLLTLAFSRELAKRAKLDIYNSLDDAVQLIKRSQNIVVLTGAGISTSLGIPDFRSKATGLYSQLEKLGLGITDPQEVFNIDVFRDDPTIFYTVAKDILPANNKQFTPTHAFIAMLQNQGKLLTNYSQNIDNIEANAGIRKEKLVQCHGSFASATCQQCGHQVPGDTIFTDIKAGRIPRCVKCITTLRGANRPIKRKRSYNSASSKRGRRYGNDSSDDDYDIPDAGVMKPDITFFGEALPDEFGSRLVDHDRNLVDLVIVIGTSLKVAPVSELVPFLPPDVPQLYISRTPVTHINFDIDLLGDCDVVVAELCRRAGWDLQHEMIPPDQQVDIQLEEGYQSRYTFRVVNPKPELEVKTAYNLEPTS
ncbi:NAD-dependent histone deacetylase sir2 [Diatrype stigma]|uniref:NAD-dependent histone deacetylase sir2 n=1 Tax=Diatrype stigma TaxID=117547 RepID=A0AAN9UU71_9PEZI